MEMAARLTLQWQAFVATLDQNMADFKTQVRAEFEKVLDRAEEERARGLEELTVKRRALQEEIKVRVCDVCMCACVGDGGL
jgi:hypothetical protein